MADKKREVDFEEIELCVDVPSQLRGITCRQVLFNELFDPGIGAMIVDPTDIAFFRVR